MLISGKALAVDGNVWPKPEAPGVTQFVKYAENDTMYMYNVAAKMFFVGGNDYNTRASVGIKGYKVIFVQTDDGLELRDSVETQSAVKCTFSTEDAAAIWVDNSNETWRFWTVTENGDSYRISNAVSAAGLFLGWKNCILAFIIGCVLGSIIHLIRMKVSKQDHVLAFGPYLAAGIFIASLWGENIVNSYLSYY